MHRSMRPAMPKPDLHMLRDRLLEEGVAPRHVVRIILELYDHHKDLELEGLQQGLDSDAASRQASTRMGTEELIVAHVVCRTELKSWCYRPDTEVA